MNRSSLVISFVIITLCALWLVSGVFSSDKAATQVETQTTGTEHESKPFTVEVAELQAQPFVPDIIITGQSKASRIVDLSAEVAAQVKSIEKEKGQKVEEGEVILNLDTDDRQANVRQAQERLRQRQIEYEAAVNLEKKGFAPRINTAQKKAELEGARAELEGARLMLADVNVKAPFSGIVDRQYVEVGDYVSIGQELIKLVDLDPLEFNLFASEKDIQNITVGQKADIFLTDGTQLRGTVGFVAVSADPDTRTFPVEIEVPNENLKYKEGMTANIRLSASEVQAHKLPSSSIVLNTEGDVGVRIVNEDSSVNFVPLKILQNNGREIWVTGLASSVRVIVRGQDFVTDGDKVEVSLAGEGTMSPTAGAGTDDQPDN